MYQKVQCLLPQTNIHINIIPVQTLLFRNGPSENIIMFLSKIQIDLIKKNKSMEEQSHTQDGGSKINEYAITSKTIHFLGEKPDLRFCFGGGWGMLCGLKYLDKFKSTKSTF